ncbi:hypothetical protein CANARDRAFT_184225, partial [[Candida] arabinofermentans NRRL YB-2248]
RLEVIRHLLHYLLQIHNLTPRSNNTDIIAIPLYDMKLVSQLLNIIVVEGVYACLPENTGIPLQKRRLKNFTVPVSITPVNFPDSKPILQAVVDTFIEILQGDSDLKNLVVVGTGFTDALTAAIVLYLDDPTETNSQQYKQLEAKSTTYDLISLYTLFLSQQQSTSTFRNFVLSRLTDLITIRKNNGVQALIEVIMGLRESEDVDFSKIDHVVRVLLNSKPQGMNSKDYYENIGQQLYDQLVFVNRPMMCSIVAHICEIIFNKNELIVTHFIFAKVWKCFNPVIIDDGSNDIILTREAELNNAFNVLISLTRRSTSKQFLTTLFSPILVSFWSYLVYRKRKNDKDYKIVQSVLISMLAFSNDDDLLVDLINNLLSLYNESWTFDDGDNNLVIIKERLNNNNNNNDTKIFDDMELVITLFIDVLQALNESVEDKIQFVFILVLKRWLKLNTDDTKTLIDDDTNYLRTLLDLRILQAIVEKFKDSLSKDPEDLLEIVDSILKKESSVSGSTTNNTLKFVKVEDADSDDEDEQDLINEEQESTVTVLEILKTIIEDTTSSNLTIDSINLLKSIKSQLIQKYPKNDLIETLTNFLNNQSEKDIKSTTESKQNNVLYNRAMKSLHDSSPPMRVNGLHTIRQLLYNKTPTPGLTIDSAINLHLNQLKDQEPFVYLNAIRGLEELLSETTTTTTKSTTLSKFLDIYTSFKKPMNERLRIGEVLLRFIQNHGDVTSLYADQLITSTLSLIRKPTDKVKAAVDEKLRISAISLLGSTCYNISTISLTPYISDIVDCMIGILNFEVSENESQIRRSTILLLNDIITSPNGDRLNLIGIHGSKLDTVLHFVVENDCDLLVREAAQGVLVVIDDLFGE